MITTLLDQCGGSSVMASLEELVSIATLDLRIDYMKPATAGLDIIGYSHSTITKHGRRVTNVRVKAWQDDPERPVAAAHEHFLMPQGL